MILRIASYILLFVILSSCGGGGGSSTENTNDSITQPSNNPFVYTPPSTTSTDNCVAKSQPVANSWLEDFNSNELNINDWSYDEGCNDNGGGCNGNNEAQNYTSNDSDNLFIEDGYLKIQPIYEQNTGSDGVNQQYTSAKIYTKDKKLFTYPAKISICFKVPEGTMIPPNGYTVFYEGDFNPNGSGFSLNSAHGDILNLSVIDEKGNPTGYRSVQSIPPAANGVSVGLVSTSQGMRFTALAQRSFGNDMPSTLADFRTGEGSENSLPLIGPIVINEIQFEALSSFSELDQAQLEYIELHNISNRTIPLFNPIEPLNTWRLSGGVSVTFPIGINLPIDGYILLVGFDPLKNPSVESRFRDYYNVPEDIQIIGPLNGRLSNGGETISLLRPDNKQGLDQADAGYVPYISVERISYDNVSPWPSNAGGSGLSIQRTSKFKFDEVTLITEESKPTLEIVKSNGGF